MKNERLGFIYRVVLLIWLCALTLGILISKQERNSKFVVLSKRIHSLEIDDEKYKTINNKLHQLTTTYMKANDKTVKHFNDLFKGQKAINQYFDRRIK